MSPPIHPLTGSQEAVFLVNSRQGYFRCGPSYDGQALFRRYGRFFAEFLGVLSFVRLALLELHTCVGLRYGRHVHKLRSFSWKALHDSPLRPKPRVPHARDSAIKGSAPDFPGTPILERRRQSNKTLPFLSSVPPSLYARCRNINLLSIACGFRHRLRPD